MTTTSKPSKKPFFISNKPLGTFDRIGWGPMRFFDFDTREAAQAYLDKVCLPGKTYNNVFEYRIDERRR